MPADSVFAGERYKQNMAILHKFAEGPMPRIHKNVWQWEMSTAHICFIENIERTYAYAVWATENNDLGNFLGFAEIAIVQICKHHQFEEDKIYPFFAKHSGIDPWSKNVAEHHTFSTPLELLWLYLRHSRETLSPPPKPVTSPVPTPPEEILSLDRSQAPLLDFNKPFDPYAMRRHMDSFMDILTQHLTDEIDTLTPEIMTHFPQEKDKELRKMMEEHFKAYDPAWFLCSAFTTVDITLLKEIIPLPFLVRRVLVPFILGPKYSGFWLYSKYPQNLTWAGTA
ncbi:hypothetical protein M231_00625 [Tremella mesenterica]|uniref:Hemerythrin-like domain-containing protein n=1 Tax=Tremella mesenterica TaxID=5217 RepID=A0A4Q1BUU1_TREME|nr:hypothetical protein M231_00625 [Tremella mesenterica]